MKRTQTSPRQRTDAMRRVSRQRSSPAAARLRGALASLLQLFLSVCIILILWTLLLPYFGTVLEKGQQTKALHQARSIGLALRLYAEDHDGIYPTGENIHGEKIRTANDAFRSLFPAYTQSERLFVYRGSTWGASADGVVSPITEALKPGENAYAYVMGLRADSNPNWPLVVDGTDGTGHYTAQADWRGSVGKNDRAIVVRLDNSGSTVPLAGPADARYIPMPGAPERNFLDVAAYSGGQLSLLDPAAAPESEPKASTSTKKDAAVTIW